ncbi:MAG TPA: hypothetical protein VMT91_01660 [Anaerolineales bacterium]|nr:hypothetical protein [Anaerolineales bacterium]
MVTKASISESVSGKLFIKALAAGMESQFRYRFFGPIHVLEGAGSRIRITVPFADADNLDTPILEPAPTLQLLREVDHPSYMELPIIHQENF